MERDGLGPCSVNGVRGTATEQTEGAQRERLQRPGARVATLMT
jgi:hypothetical protein